MLSYTGIRSGFLGILVQYTLYAIYSVLCTMHIILYSSWAHAYAIALPMFMLEPMPMPIPTAKPISEPMPMLMFMLMFMLMIMLIGYACANGNASAYVFNGIFDVYPLSLIHI